MLGSSKVKMIQHKFKNKIVERNGIKFRSAKEARYYDTLEIEKRAGIVLFFLMQVPFHLPGNTKYVVDFQVFYTNGTVRFIDVKGFRTRQYITKKKQVEALYPVEIIEV